jgi:large subunit ribosomal protein L18
MSDFHRKRVLKKRDRQLRAHRRARQRVRGTAARPRLAVHKSLKYIYAQVIDDDLGRTLAQASSRESDIRTALKAGTASKEAARVVGETIAKRAKDTGVEAVVFDRGGVIYHGRVKELAEAARAQGLRL